MLRFKAFISEGGNIQLGTKGNPGPKAAPFDSSTRATTSIDIHNALSDLHDKVKKEHGVELFGKAKKALHTNTAFHTGSTEFFFDKSIDHEKYNKAIPKTGDIDTLVDGRHKEHLESTLENMKSGSKLGNTTYLGWKRGAGESHILLGHPSHEHPIQIDLNHVDYKNDEPDEFARFGRSGGSIEDRQIGLKGMHRNRMLHAAASISGYKWSNMKGLKHKDDNPKDMGITEPDKISKTVFGASGSVKSTSDVVNMIKKHIPKEKHQAIMDNFAGSSGREDETMKPAISYLQKHLGVK